MSLGILGKKLGMTRLFDQQAGSMIPVTVIDVTGYILASSGIELRTPTRIEDRRGVPARRGRNHNLANCAPLKCQASFSVCAPSATMAFTHV